MLKLRTMMIAIAGLLVFAITVDTALSWPPNEKKPPAFDFEKAKATDFTGKIAGSKGNIIAVKTFAEQPIYVMIAPQFLERLLVMGTAEQDALKPKSYVRFTATVDDEGTGSEVISELSLVTPVPGLEPASVEAGQATEILGLVSRFKDGELVVTNQGKGIKRITVKVAPDAKVNLMVSDASMAKPGDDVHVIGKIYQENQIIATQLEITLAAPYTTRKGPRSTRTAPKGEGDKPAEDPFAAAAKEAKEEKKEEN